MGYSRGTSTKGFVTGLLVVPVSILAACFANASTLIEPPYFKEEVAQGRLLPVAERVPENPRVIDLKSMGRVSGQYGGRLRMLMGDPKDIRMMVVYGYSRLIGYDENLNFVPDILED